ncbi:hypothetical protein KDRO_B00160 [Kluyveromyces lactis]|nr:hypothetical protein KDRO_B00160 [Kluyveromyces lactis]
MSDQSLNEKSGDHFENQMRMANHDPSEPSAYNDLELQKIHTGGDNHEFVFIGRQKFLKEDLFTAFGGTLNPGLAPPSTHKFANPAPLGLSAFALTTFVLSMFNARAMGVTIPNVVVGSAAFYGGLVQLIAGIWEIALENTFGGTALSSFGGFWMSFSALYIPFFGIADAYKEHPEQFSSAVGFFLLGWAIFTAGMTVCTMKSTVAFFSLFFLLTITFLLLSIGEFAQNTNVTRAGGVIGVIVAFIAWYDAFAGVATKENSYVTVRPLPLPKPHRTLF